MHKRLTRQRVERWATTTNKHGNKLTSLVSEVSGYRVDSKGGNHADLLKMQVSLAEALTRLEEAEAVMRDFKDRRWPNQ